MQLLDDSTPTTIAAVAMIARLAPSLHSTPVPAKIICADLGLYPRHMETRFQALVAAGVLKGVRGPRGGYVMRVNARDLTLGTIVAAEASVRDAARKDLPADAKAAIYLSAPWAAEVARMTLLDVINQADRGKLDAAA